MDVVGRLLGGRYRIVRGIGAGGMGGVFEAVQEGLGRRVAVKVIADQLADEPEFIERFRREAMAAAQLGHPNIVQVTDFQHTPGEPPFLVMEMLEGEPLNRRLKRGPLPMALAVDIAMQILSALEAAHAQGVVHRDLKPGNIFLTPLPRGRVLAKVLDFGIAKLMDSATYGRLTQTGVLLGTPRYAAPEQILDSKGVDPRTDVYAVGALLYCMLAGRPPHMSSGAQLLVDVREREPTDPRVSVAEVSAELTQVTRRAMQKSRRARFQTAREFREALELLAGAPTAEPSAGPRPSFPATTVMPVSEPTAAPPGRHESATVASRPARQAPPTRPTRTARHTEPQPSPQVVHASRPSDPTHTTERPKPKLGLILGSVFGIVLGAVLLGAAGSAVWLGYLQSRPSPFTDEPPVVAVAPLESVSEVCREAERIACSCSAPAVRERECPIARLVNASGLPGESRLVECQQMLERLRACGGDGSGEAEEAAVARSETGLAECDEYTRLACTCGQPGRARNGRCRVANSYVTEGLNYYEEPSVVRGCRERRRALEPECHEAP